MNDQVYFDQDLDPSLILDKTVAVLGYGAQGRAHALNLRDSGVTVIVGQRPGRGFEAATADGFSPVPLEPATEAADIIALLLPDEVQGPVFESSVHSALAPGKTLLVCHGFSVHYGQIQPPSGVASLLVAPKAAGHMVRTAYEKGGGVPCLVGVADESQRSSMLPLALAYAWALGGGRAGILETTFAEETETDLFGEQAVLCGGVSHLAIAAFETLVEAGYREEVAYFECVHELKLVVDLLHRGGLAFMRDHISNTAEYGDYTRGPRLVDEHVRTKMKQILEEIRDGTFAREWIEEARQGGEAFQAMRAEYQNRAIETTGQRLHRTMKLV